MTTVETRKYTSSTTVGGGGGGGFGGMSDRDREREQELGMILKEREKEIEKEQTGNVESARYESRYTRSEERSEGRDYGRGGEGRYGRDASSGTYRPMMTSRNIVIQRSQGGPPSWSYGGGSDRVSRTIERRYGSNYGGLPAGSYAHVTNTEVNSMRVSREKEKRDMQDLNERFASYIEKVRFLEAQNKKLADELEKLKSNWGKETSAVKTMFQTELTEARRLLDENERDKARLELKNASLEDQVADLRSRLDETSRIALQDREKVEKQNQQLSDYEAEINLLRRRVEGLENDKDRDRRQINQLTENVNRARMVNVTELPLSY